MERVENTENTIEVFENDIEMYLSMFCERDNIDDLRSESQSVWNAALRFVYNHVFKGGVLKQKTPIVNENSKILSTYNSYNYDLVAEVLDLYIYDMCMRYNKEVSIVGFSALTGIEEATIHEWGNGRRLSQTSVDIYKKLHHFREESLSNKLATGKQNPVGVIAILNKHYGWNMPGVTRETSSKRTLSAADLPKLSEIKQQIDDECVQLEDKTTETSEIVESAQ